MATSQTTQTETKTTNALLHGRPVTVTFPWHLFNIIKMYFISPTYVSYISILSSSSTAASQTNILSTSSTSLIPTPANKSFLTQGTALISASLSHTRAKMSSHQYSPQRRDAVFCNNSKTLSWHGTLLRPAQSCQRIYTGLPSPPCGISISWLVCRILPTYLFLYRAV